MSNNTHTLQGIETASRYVQTSAASTLALFYKEDNAYHFIEVKCTLPVMLLAFRETNAGAKNKGRFILKVNGLSKATRSRLTPFICTSGTLCHADALSGVRAHLSAFHGIKNPNNGHALEYLYALHVNGVWDNGNNTPYYIAGDVQKPNGQAVQCKHYNGSISETSTLTAIKYMYEGM